MSVHPRAGSYRAVLALPGVCRAFVPAIVGRLSYGIIPLALLLTAENATGSYAVAGLVLAVFGLTAIIDPWKSRLVDQYGQPRVLGILAVVYPTTLFAYAAVARAGVDGAAIHIGLGVIAGVVTPPLGPSMRAVWAQVTPDSQTKIRAYSLDSVIEESLYAIGPAIVGGLLLITDASTGVFLAAVLALIGTAGLASAPAAVGASPIPLARSRPFGEGPLAAEGFVPVIVVIAGVGLALGVLDVVVPALTSLNQTPAAAGPLLAMMAVGSTAGGLVWGRLKLRSSNIAQLRTLTLLLVGGIIVTAWITNLIMLAFALLLLGTLIAPAFIVAYLTTDELTTKNHRTEASTWINTANNLGAAAGSALAGLLVDLTTLAIAILTGAAILLAAIIPTLAQHRSDQQ